LESKSQIRDAGVANPMTQSNFRIGGNSQFCKEQEQPVCASKLIAHAPEPARRLREAQFVAIVTPSVKHITTELARG